MRVLKVLVEPLVEEDDLDDEDIAAIGEYTMEVPISLSDSEAAAMTLDLFHAGIPIRNLEDFEFSVIDENGRYLREGVDQ